MFPQVAFPEPATEHTTLSNLTPRPHPSGFLASRCLHRSLSIQQYCKLEVKFSTNQRVAFGPQTGSESLIAGSAKATNCKTAYVSVLGPSDGIELSV